MSTTVPEPLSGANEHSPVTAAVVHVPSFSSPASSAFGVVPESRYSSKTPPASALPAGSTFLTLTVAGWQRLMSTGIGAMKSFSAAVNESDERLFRYAAPNASHAPGPSWSAELRSIAASPKPWLTTGTPAMGSKTPKPSLTAPSAAPLVLRSRRTPQHGSMLLASQTVAASPVVTQRCRPSRTTLPPDAKSNVISRSPAERTGVLPFALLV